MSAAEMKDITESVKEETAIMKVSRMAIGLCERVKALIVKDQTTYDNATDLYGALVAMEKEIDATHDPVIAHWHEKHKAALAEKNKDSKPVAEAKKLVKQKASAWQDEQERIRLEAQRKAEEEARKIQAELERQAREAQEVERKRLAAIEEEERLKLAMEAKESGASEEQVTEILDAPIYTPEPEPFVAPVVVAPVVEQTYQKASGFSVRTNYTATVVSLDALVKAAAANPFFVQYLLPNQTAINALAKSSKDAFVLPGCQLKKERV